MSAGSLQNLNEGRIEALQALRNVSAELKDILRDDGTRRNENGELVNEEGLPIVDISEPVDDLETPSGAIMQDNLPKRLSPLSSEARSRRDKILLMLEEEEEREARRSREEVLLERQRQKERAQKEMQKRMMDQAKELDRAKEFEKKMAKALMGGLAKSQTQTGESTSAGAQLKKKTVSFADSPSQESEHFSTETKRFGSTWGDAVSGRVPTRDRFTEAPMKMEVSERRTHKSNINESISQINNAGQSHTPETSMLTPAPRGQETLNFKDSLEDSDDESDSDATSVLEDGDVALSAQHHRKLALEYHRRREALIASAKSFPLEEQFLEGKKLDPADWDKEDVPLEATLAHPPPKPSISKFKSSIIDKKVPTFTPSVSGKIVLPPTALANSVRMGKVIDDKLVASSADEEGIDKEEEEIRQLLLRSMAQYAEIASQTMGSSRLTPAPDVPSTLQSNVKPKPKASRFKVNRSSHVERPSEAHPPLMQAAAPVEDTARSNNHIDSIPQLARGTQSLTSSARTAAMSSGSIIDSPSFPSTASYSTAINISSKRTSQSLSPSFEQPMIIDSPSFIQPSSLTKASLHMSPSTVQRTDNTQPLTSESQQRSPLQDTEKAIPVPERRPATVIPVPSARPSIRTGSVMSNMVKERVVDRNHINDGDTRANPKKMSRFKAKHEQS